MRTATPNALSATEALAAIAAGTLTVEALARACLDRIAEREPTIHAFVFVEPDRVIDAARALDRIPRDQRGPLHGLPIGVKDIIDTHDMPTAYGSPIYAGHRPAHDASCVALAREAGALIVGKTVTTEFALRHPGPTSNPCVGRAGVLSQTVHTPGGSSSGSAAAVADCMVPIAFGTQTGGSIIRPASYCGVVGYKPSFGTINPTGVKPLANSFDTVGLIARSVDDCALVAGVLAGNTWRSPLQAIVPTRIGLCRTHAWSDAEPATVRAIEMAAAQLMSAGVAIDDVTLSDDFAGFLDAQADVLRFEAARVFAFERTRHSEKLAASSRTDLEYGRTLPYARYREAQLLISHCRSLFAQAIAPHDCLLSPSAAGEAPRGLDNTGEAMFNRLQSGLGVPCITLPGDTGPNGLPVGIQLTGAMQGDARMLALAKWIGNKIANRVKGPE